MSTSLVGKWNETGAWLIKKKGFVGRRKIVGAMSCVVPTLHVFAEYSISIIV
jgi:hypothetical protein